MTDSTKMLAGVQPVFPDPNREDESIDAHALESEIVARAVEETQ